MSLRFIIILSVLGIYSVTAQFEEYYLICTSEAYLTDGKKCMDKYNSSIKIANTSALEFYAGLNRTICGLEDEYLDTINCLNDALLKCFNDDNIKLLFPSYEKSFKYLCSQMDTRKCSKLTVPTANAGYEDWKTYLCNYRKLRKSCSERTRMFNIYCPETKILYQGAAKIENPAACGGEAGYESGKFKTEDSEGGEFNSALCINNSILLFLTMFFFTTLF